MLAISASERTYKALALIRTASEDRSSDETNDREVEDSGGNALVHQTTEATFCMSEKVLSLLCCHFALTIDKPSVHRHE